MGVHNKNNNNNIKINVWNPCPGQMYITRREFRQKVVTQSPLVKGILSASKLLMHTHQKEVFFVNGIYIIQVLRKEMKTLYLSYFSMYYSSKG